MPARIKVTAFILRLPQKQILLHSFSADPSLAWRLPGGSVEGREIPLISVYREVREETGLKRVEVIRKLGVQHYYKAYLQSDVYRHDFLLRVMDPTPDEWEYTVTGTGGDAGEVYHLQWVSPDRLDSLNIDDEHRRYMNAEYIAELFSD